MSIDPSDPAFLRGEVFRQAKLATGAMILLRDVADCGVSFDDPRLGYVEVQIDRATWEAVALFRSEP